VLRVRAIVDNIIKKMDITAIIWKEKAYEKEDECEWRSRCYE
jgi:hypothetical protein